MAMTKLKAGATAVAALIGFALAGPQFGLPGKAQAEESYLRGFVGDWRGQGSLRRGPQAPAESVVCRVQGTMNSSRELVMNGRCGGEGFTGTFRITAQYNPVNGTYSALFAGPPTVGSSQLEGQRAADSLQLAVHHPNLLPSTLEISQLSGDAFRIHSRSSSRQGVFTSAEIQLRRQ